MRPHLWLSHLPLQTHDHNLDIWQLTHFATSCSHVIAIYKHFFWSVSYQIWQKIPLGEAVTTWLSSQRLNNFIKLGLFMGWLNLILVIYNRNSIPNFGGKLKITSMQFSRCEAVKNSATDWSSPTNFIQYKGLGLSDTAKSYRGI